MRNRVNRKTSRGEEVAPNTQRCSILNLNLRLKVPTDINTKERNVPPRLAVVTSEPVRNRKTPTFVKRASSFRGVPRGGKYSPTSSGAHFIAWGGINSFPVLLSCGDTRTLCLHVYSTNFTNTNTSISCSDICCLRI